MPTTIRRSLHHALFSAVATVLFAAGLVFVPTATPDAEAVTVRKANQIMRIAASKRGAPYRYGAAGPHRFDCSGYTQWVFRKAGIRIPRTSRQQAAFAKHIKASQRRRGDLVFFRSNGRVYHVGIYAGKHTIWHSPRTGERVKRQKIWSRSISYGRIR